MKYRIEYISTFYEEIRSIANYLANSPMKAARIFALIEKNIKIMEDMPELYPSYRYAPNFRFFTVEDYLLLYKFNKTTGIIEIHHLINGRMDILALLNE